MGDLVADHEVGAEAVRGAGLGGENLHEATGAPDALGVDFEAGFQPRVQVGLGLHRLREEARLITVARGGVAIEIPLGVGEEPVRHAGEGGGFIVAFGESKLNATGAVIGGAEAGDGLDGGDDVFIEQPPLPRLRQLGVATGLGAGVDVELMKVGTEGAARRSLGYLSSDRDRFFEVLAVHAASRELEGRGRLMEPMTTWRAAHWAVVREKDSCRPFASTVISKPSQEGHSVTLTRERTSVDWPVHSSNSILRCLTRWISTATCTGRLLSTSPGDYG